MERDRPRYCTHLRAGEEIDEAERAAVAPWTVTLNSIRRIVRQSHRPALAFGRPPRRQHRLKR